MKQNENTNPPSFLRCVMRTGVNGKPGFSRKTKTCGEMMELEFEGSGKYDGYICPVHGGISVHKGTRR